MTDIYIDKVTVRLCVCLTHLISDFLSMGNTYKEIIIIIINRLNFFNDRATRAQFVGENNKNIQYSKQLFKQNL